MPATSPRINVTLPPEIYALYKSFAQVSGNSMSSMLAEIAVTSAPALERVLRVVIAAKEAEQARKDGMKQAFQQAEAELQPLLDQASSTLGVALAHIERAATAKPAEAQPAGRRRPGPPASNTGVRSRGKHGKKGRA